MSTWLPTHESRDDGSMLRYVRRQGGWVHAENEDGETLRFNATEWLYDWAEIDQEEFDLS